MEKLKKSSNHPPTPLLDLSDSSANYSKNQQDKIYNVVKIHHYKEDTNNFTVNTKTSSITVNPDGSNQSYFSQKVQKTFLLDSVLTHETIFTDLLTAVIKRAAENENSLIVSVNRGTRKSSRLWNKDFLETLITWLYRYLKLCEDNADSKFSVRISTLEIDEENDILTDIGKQKPDDEDVNDFLSIDNTHCRRCNDIDAAFAFFNENIHTHQRKSDKSKKHVLHIFHLYQQTNLKSSACSVSSKSSKIFLLNLDLTKCRNQQHSMSLPLLSKFIISHLNGENRATAFDKKFQKLFSDIFQRNISFHSFITQVSGKDKKFQDSYQLLQMSGRIQRLKIKLKKNWDCRAHETKNSQRNWCPKIVKYSSHKSGGKFSDSEITSNSEISCAETVICLREHKRGNSDDESMISRRFRSVFISSDSDSGCKDLRMSQSSYSRCGTPVNTYKRKTHPRTNALAWPKNAIRMAKTVILNGQELWVDGPNVLQRPENIPDKPNYSASTTSTPETVKQVLGTICKSAKATMKSQETQYEYQTINTIESTTEFHPLSDISEITDEVDLLKSASEYIGLSDIRYNSLNSRVSPTKYNIQSPPVNPTSLSPKNDVRKVSKWINDVNQLTSIQIPVSKSYHEQFATNQCLQSAINASINNHSYHYYDDNSSNDYSSYPRLYSPQRHLFPINKNDSKQISYINEDELKSTTISDKKLFNRYKKKETNVSEMKDMSKLRCFMSKSPLGILKKTLFQSKSSKKKLEVSDPLTDLNVSNCQEIRYLVPTTHVEDSSDSSSDSECNEWFRNIKTFKSKLEATASKYSSLRPPSAPLLVGTGCVLNSQHTTRQRSSSSGYGSVITKDSEVSSHIDSNSDQSIHSFSKPSIKQSISFTHNRAPGSVPCELDPDLIAKRCESLVKQEKALLLMQHQELMIQDFYNTTRPLLTNDESKYTLRMSTVNYDRLLFDSQYLDELEEDTNIIRDSIAFYKSLVHLESSFLSSPERHRKQLN